jgi:putative transposase
VRYRFVQEHAQQFPIALLCRVLEVSPSGYHAWRSRPEAPRGAANRALRGRLREIHQAHRRCYGRRRLHAQLQAEGVSCSPNRVARLMQQEGISGRIRRAFRVTTDAKHGFPVAPNRLGRDFAASAPDQVWVSDITYLPTEEGWLYLATVMDLYSRRIVGWAMQASLERSLTVGALEMAITQRQPGPGLLHHSDRGSQYACGDYQQALCQHGMVCSMSRKGDPWDNACAESFFRALKCELVHRAKYETREQARREVFEYIEVFYNRKRLHSSLGYQAPVDFERKSVLRTA